MCIGTPVQIVEVKGFSGLARDGENIVGIDLALTGPVDPGTWVLNFLGAAREVLDEDEALKIRAALGGLRKVMQGEDYGDAFADLENRAPQLPAHLQAAFDAGETTG
ncbi:MAG: HypC/HybG/HupF family hydrogenase formation chaperone [Pseudomonadota bacterium]